MISNNVNRLYCFYDTRINEPVCFKTQWSERQQKAFQSSITVPFRNISMCACIYSLSFDTNKNHPLGKCPNIHQKQSCLLSRMLILSTEVRWRKANQAELKDHIIFKRPGRKLFLYNVTFYGTQKASTLGRRKAYKQEVSNGAWFGEGQRLVKGFLPELVTFLLTANSPCVVMKNNPGESQILLG